MFKLFKKKKTDEDQIIEQDYVELDTDIKEEEKKILVKTYTLSDFEDVKQILDALREGHTIALINISSLRDKDMLDLKRAISKIKKTCEAIEGDIAGFDENWVVAVPNFAKIDKSASDHVEGY